MSNIDLEDNLKDRSKDIPGKFSIVTVHDATPENKSKIRNILDKLDEISIAYNIAVITFYNEKKKNDIRNDKDFVKILSHKDEEIALHGLYHERNGDLEEFGNLSLKDAIRTIRTGLNMFKDVGLDRVDSFVPPTWAVNKDTVDALKSLNFKLLETEEEVILLNKRVRLLSTILNWDLGSLRTDLRYHDLIKKLFKRQLSYKSKLIRIAVHPKDPKGILTEQCKMIRLLQKERYVFLKYSDIDKNL